ncbi:bifunctional diaminohydroxyphosphoribosylaminopyrimidine deaminase/5-amino-6-(5-phosphoribosylamino)uracil reductase RibD [Microvirga flavescens]|uniref:bifunctional diaminohydroxyphosphoribosylaminopyrimidine deaminase/5-amino-6-(5-phosphoribosylamino)uracil reductase RibD n=1 Tax=Microvirga flavescens TaxID=2249811 RepID=UPI001FE204AD|nr:bifunctional diaminohydroxyphosphoribosylaminopyrimidine deaminase/5-amino-6-(5-phosphoribosylamino)uracil reductase RibD [Microvirga flavescens]
MTAAANDERFMRLALALGARHLGLTAPNPSVGAVVVREEGGSPLIVAQGITQPGGRPHAERVALGVSGEAAKGATLYVTLEPCSHHGKSPPCVDAVIASGIARVVSAIEDPDDRVAGEGHTRLRQAGIRVDVGCLAEQARRDHRGHIMRVTKGRPAITVKLARTTEGLAGTRNGPRLMITGDLTNARVQMMRAHADAIMVGVGTVLTDDPLLTVRLPGLEDRSPVRIVIDSHLRTPADAKLVKGARNMPSWIVTTVAASVEAEKRLVQSGIEVLRVGADAQGRVALAEAMRLLGTRGLTRVFSEGGPGLADALASADLIDELVLATGRSARGQGDVPALGPVLQDRMDEMRLIGDEMLGPDLLMSWERA